MGNIQCLNASSNTLIGLYLDHIWPPTLSQASRILGCFLKTFGFLEEAPWALYVHVVDGYIFLLNYLDLEFAGTDMPKYSRYSPGMLVWDRPIPPIVSYWYL
jgi:hypothetical protein